MRVDQFLADEQTETRADAMAGLSLPELFEHMRKVFRPNTPAGVRNLELDLVSGCRGLHGEPDFAARRRRIFPKKLPASFARELDRAIRGE